MAKILIIEDENHIRRLIQTILERAGYELTATSSGEEGLEVLQDDKEFDMILLDIMMPGLDGLQVLKKLKENPSTQNIPVILLSALAQENVVLKGISLGAKAYLRKPFHPSELVNRIGQFLKT